jgi:predicted AAA+ superfamily ATPase
MYPLTAQELGESFNLSHALRYGLLPTAVTHEHPQQYLENYVQTYVQEEVLQEGLTRNIGSFTRFLEVASFSQGSVITVTDIARELGLTRFTVANYFSILEDLLLSVRIPPFTLRAKRKMVAHEKFYYFDTGVYRALRPMYTGDTHEQVDGAALETLFLQSVRALNEYLGLGYKIFFWRTVNGQEVDFILYGPHGLHAFEIKRTARVSTKMFRPLKAFAEEYPEAHLHLLHFGDHTEYYGPITATPFEQALLKLPDLLQSQSNKTQSS